MTKAEAGRLGGKSTLRRYGKAHMREIGKQGAKVTWSTYKLVPFGTANFAMTNRLTGEVVATIIQWRM